MITCKAVVSLVVIALIVYGFYREDKVIALEDRMILKFKQWRNARKNRDGTEPVYINIENRGNMR